jgi:hypothetical protein
MADKLQDHLAYPPRGMDVDRAAAYVGIGRTKFLEVVEDGRMRQPVRIEEELPRLHEQAASRGAVHVALLSATSWRDFHCAG